MDKITIEELAVFLPYRLCAEVFAKDVDPSFSEDSKVMIPFYIEHLPCCQSKLIHMEPIVRPMSKLFEPFQYAGETVNVGDMIIEEWNKKISPGMIIPLELQKDPMQWEYWQIQIAAKYHFDIFGWLDKGLANEKP